MFGSKKKDKNNDKEPSKKGWFGRLSQGLKRTRGQLSDNIANALLGRKTIDDDLMEELESTLIMADIGVSTTQYLLDQVNQKVSRKAIEDPQALLALLKEEMRAILAPCQEPLNIEQAKPFVLLTVGVNGAGKTTSIAKITHHFQQQKKKILLAAGDTYRAAAIEQLTTWAERNNVPIITQKHGSDSASVIYDAMASATARQVDLLIADTAGRLHTQKPLMNELEKIKRVMNKKDADTPHETLLVLDASMGQNALVQARAFHDAVGITGLCLTKLDGTAKGGILFAIAKQLQLPIRFIGVGEQVDDLQPFNADTFIDALFENINTSTGVES